MGARYIQRHTYGECTGVASGGEGDGVTYIRRVYWSGQYTGEEAYWSGQWGRGGRGDIHTASVLERPVHCGGGILWGRDTYSDIHTASVLAWPVGVRVTG